MLNSMEVPQYFELVGNALSLVFNVFLLYIIQSVHRPDYQAYQFLMKVMTGLYVIYSAVEMTILPSFFVDGYNYILFPTNFIDHQDFTQFLSVSYCAIFACIQVVVSAQFIYRYLSVSGNDFLISKFFKGTGHIVWISCTVIYFINWFLGSMFTFSNVGDHPKELAVAVQERFGRDVNDMGYILISYAEVQDDGGLLLKYGDIFMICYMLICASIPMNISMFCGVKTWLKMHNTASMTQKSDRMRKQERQLFFALLIQFTIPFIGNTVPMLILFLCPALHISPEPYTNLLCMPMPFYPIFDALATILIVKDYYKQMLKTFKMKSGKSSVATVTSMKENTSKF